MFIAKCTFPDQDEDRDRDRDQDQDRDQDLIPVPPPLVVVGGPGSDSDPASVRTVTESSIHDHVTYCTARRQRTTAGSAGSTPPSRVRSSGTADTGTVGSGLMMPNSAVI